MRLAVIAVLAGASVASAQTWEKVSRTTVIPAAPNQMQSPPPIQQPQYQSPPPQMQGQPPQPLAAAPAPQPVKLPREENLLAVDLRSVRVQYLAHRAVVTINNKVFREFGSMSEDAEATAKLFNDLLVVRWGILGNSRVVVEYGLTVGQNGELMVAPGTGFPRTVQPIDLKSVRAEAIRGAWCLRDNSGVLLNFGPEQLEAEQAAAVCRKYGFNRIGTVGKGKEPAVTYFFARPETITKPNPLADLQRQREVTQSRSGVEVPGLGFVGEKITLDAKKLEVRRMPGGVTLRHGPDLIASFGNDEWGAMDAVRVIQEGHFTDFCRVGSAVFFLKDGKPPQAPFHALGRRFDPGSLQAREINGKWWIIDVTHRPLLAVTDEKDANDTIRVIRSFGFDTLAAVGNSPATNLQFLAKSR